MLGRSDLAKSGGERSVGGGRGRAVWGRRLRAADAGGARTAGNDDGSGGNEPPRSNNFMSETPGEKGRLASEKD